MQIKGEIVNLCLIIEEQLAPTELRFNVFCVFYKHCTPTEFKVSCDLCYIKPQSGGMFVEIEKY